MAVLGWSLLGLVAAILVVAGVALALPVEIRFRVIGEAGVRLEVHGRALAGATPWLRLSGRKRGPRPKEKPARARKTSRLGGAQGRRIGLALPRLLRDLIGAIRITRFAANLTFGLGDPAETGQLFGRLCPLAYAVPAAEVALRPDFDRPCLEGWAELTVQITPMALVPPFARFGWRAFGPVE